MRFLCPADVGVACVSGTAWITTTANICDVVLEAGDCQRASGGDFLFICGMHVCELRIEAYTPVCLRTIEAQPRDRPDQPDSRCVLPEAGHLAKA